MSHSRSSVAESELSSWIFLQSKWTHLGFYKLTELDESHTVFKLGHGETYFSQQLQPTFTLHFPTCSCCESAENLKPVSKRPIFLCRSEYSLCRRTRTSTATYEFGLSCVCNHGTVNCNQIFRGLKIHIFICIQKDFSQETLEHILCVLI